MSYLARAQNALFGLCVMACGLGLGGACADSSRPEDPPGPPTVLPDLPPLERSGSFTLTIDPSHPALTEAGHPGLEPTAAPVTVGGAAPQFAVQAFAKRVMHRSGIVWVDVYFENRGDAALRDAVVEVGGARSVWDFTRDPFSEPLTGSTIALGGIGLEGVGHLALGVPSDGPSQLTLTVRGITTKRAPTSSSAVAITPDGTEVWTTFADANTVAVIDARTDTKIATLGIEGHPVSLAVTPDGQFVVVASDRGNTVTVVNRRTRAIVQTFGEERVGREPRHLVVTPDGGRVFVSSYVEDTITSLVRNGDTFRFERSTKIGRRPTGMAVTSDSGTLLVAHFLPRGVVTANEGWISTLATDSLAAPQEVAIHDHFNLDEAHCIADVFGVSPARLTTEGAPTQLAGVFMPPTGAEAWIPGARAAGAAIIWERGPKPEAGLDNLVSIRPGELLPPFLFLLDARNSRLIERQLAPGGVERPVAPEYLRCAKFQNEIEWVGRDLIPSVPGQQVNRFLAFPSGTSGLTESGVTRALAFTRGGRRALVLSFGADEIMLVDALTHHPGSQKHFPLGGSNPVGLVLTPDGAKAYVAYANSPFVSVLDTSAYAAPATLGPTYVPYEYREVKDVPQIGLAFGSKLLVRRVASVPELPQIAEIAKVAVAEDPVDPALRRGNVLFSSANPDKHPLLSKSRLGACASCHPDGGNDGSMWATMEGERRTMSLRGGVAGRGWLHSGATHADAREFVDIIVTERLGGALPPSDLDALARYVATGIPKLQHPRVDEGLAARGRSIFDNKCTGCHAGTQMTSGAPDPTSALGGGLPSGPGLYDVGTATNDAHVALSPFFESLLSAKEAELVRAIRGDRALGDGDRVQTVLDFRPRPNRAKGLFKAPSLVNVWDNVLLFHDGRFTSLRDAVEYLSTRNNLGLSGGDVEAVVEFLHTL